MRRAVFSILVDNSSGVLSRVAGLFSRRGYNIDSLTVGETLDPKLSRMTITVTGDDDILEQIEKQLAKLIDVKEIVELPHDESVCRELVLIKVLCTREERQQITTMADIYRANIVDVAKNSLIISLTGSQSKIDSFIALLDGFKITELARTGITGLARGAAKFKINYLLHSEVFVRWQRLRFIISQIVIYHYLTVRQSLLSVTAARDMHMH